MSNTTNIKVCSSLSWAAVQTWQNNIAAYVVKDPGQCLYEYFNLKWRKTQRLKD